MFTDSQIREIASKLANLGIKDSDLPKIHGNLDGNEIIAIVQDNESRSATLSELSNYLNISSDDFFVLQKDNINKEEINKLFK